MSREDLIAVGTRLFAVTLLAIAALMPLPAHAANPPREMHGQPTINVAIVLFDGVQIIDFAAPYEVFGTAGFGVVTLSADGKPVTTAMGLAVTPDHSFADAPKFDLLVVPGGNTQEAMGDDAMLGFLRKQDEKLPIMSVCTGAHILASAGLLDGRKATTFHGAFDTFGGQFPKVELIRDQRWVDSGRVVTSAGLSSGIDASLYLVSKLHDENRARSVALHLEYPWDPSGGFVRGRMLDRQAPRLAGVVWPEGTSFQSLYSIGNTEQWEARFLVGTSVSPEELLTLIAADITREGEWTREGETHAWHREIAGQRRRLVFETEPMGEEGKFFIFYKLE